MKKVGSVRPPKGHKFYELNTETGKFIEVQPKAYESYNELGKLVIQKRIEMKEKHLYITALNAKNAARKFIKFIEKASDEAPRHYESKNYY